MRKPGLIALFVLCGCTHTTLEVGAGSDASTEVGNVEGAGHQRFLGNESNCPATAPEDQQPCAVPEGESCAYWSPIPDQTNQTKYVGCTCYEKDPATMLWSCSGSSSAPFYAFCPPAEPESGTSCSDGQLDCLYPPASDCHCSNEAPRIWTCGPDTQHGGPPIAGPTNVPDEKAINGLSDAETQAWCDWFANLLPATPLAIGSDGYVRGYSARIGAAFFYENVCVPQGIPAEYCALNLELAPCTARLTDLTDCIRTLWSDLPSPHGCGRFLQAQGCEDLFVHRLNASEAGPALQACGDLRVK